MTPPRAVSTRLPLRLLGGAAVVGAIVLLFALGVVDWLRDPARVRADIAAWGAWGQLGFVALYVGTQPFGAPGTVLQFSAALIWPWPVAFAVTLVAAVLGSSLGFAMARWLLRDWLRPRIPPRILAYEARLAQRAFRTVFWLRLVFGMQQSVHALCGISRVSFWTHASASALAYVPPLLVIAIAGDQLVEWLSRVPRWVGAGALAGVAAAAVWRWKVRR